MLVVRNANARLAEFRADTSAAATAIGHWRDDAHTVAHDAVDCAATGIKLRLPAGFSELTEDVALWCDAELHIDAKELTRFLRRVEELAGWWGEPITPCESVAELLGDAWDVSQRALMATVARGQASELSNSSQRESEWQVDTKVDKKKLSTPPVRGLTKPARKCATEYKKRMAKDKKATMKAVIADYIVDNPAESESSIRRSLSAHPEAWKVDTKVNKGA
jgi:hypothetical protein